MTKQQLRTTATQGRAAYDAYKHAVRQFGDGVFGRQEVEQRQRDLQHALLDNLEASLLYLGVDLES